jgi:hypothetical protein
MEGVLPLLISQHLDSVSVPNQVETRLTIGTCRSLAPGVSREEDTPGKLRQDFQALQ